MDLLALVSKGTKKSPNRLKFAWEEMVLELGGNTAVAMDKMEHMLGLMNKADKVTPSIPGLAHFFARGAGTCAPAIRAQLLARLTKVAEHANLAPQITRPYVIFLGKPSAF